MLVSFVSCSHPATLASKADIVQDSLRIFLARLSNSDPADPALTITKFTVTKATDRTEGQASGMRLFSSVLTWNAEFAVKKDFEFLELMNRVHSISNDHQMGFYGTSEAKFYMQFKKRTFKAGETVVVKNIHSEFLSSDKINWECFSLIEQKYDYEEPPTVSF